jgi:hypothetical protein
LVGLNGIQLEANYVLDEIVSQVAGCRAIVPIIGPALVSALAGIVWHAAL